MKQQPSSNSTGRAWQPLTFGGVARYAHDWIGRLLFTGAIISFIATAVILLTARRAIIPVIDQAVTQLPPGAEIRGGRFTAPQPIRLGENSFLSIRFDPLGETSARSTSDFEIIFGPTQLRARSIFGIAPFAYPLHWTLNLNRAEIEPWWGAWRITAYAYLTAATILFLFTSWITLAIPYAIIARIAAFILKRRVSLWGSWKMSVAALMPGAILFSSGIFLYGWSQLRLTDLLGIWIAHFVVGWIFLAGAVFALPRLDLSNPFGDTPAPEETEEPHDKNPNPFHRGK